MESSRSETLSSVLMTGMACSCCEFAAPQAAWTQI
jgi:hypothetical protein